MAKTGTKANEGTPKKTNQGQSKYSKWTTKARQRKKPSRGQG